MRILGFVLVVLAGATFASDPTIYGEISGKYPGYPGTDDVIDSYAYNAAEAYTNAWGSFGSYVTADDFTLVGDATIEELLYWTLSTTAQPTTAEVRLYTDTGSGPGTQTDAVACNVANTATPISFGSYTVYESLCTLGTTLPATGGTTYWIAAVRTSADSWYFLPGTVVRGQECYLYNGGWMTWSSQGYPPTDQFRIMYGVVALERDTWGSIKTLF